MDSTPRGARLVRHPRLGGVGAWRLGEPPTSVGGGDRHAFFLGFPPAKAGGSPKREKTPTHTPNGEPLAYRRRSTCLACQHKTEHFQIKSKPKACQPCSRWSKRSGDHRKARPLPHPAPRQGRQKPTDRSFIWHPFGMLKDKEKRCLPPGCIEHEQPLPRKQPHADACGSPGKNKRYFLHHAASRAPSARGGETMPSAFFRFSPD